MRLKNSRTLMRRGFCYAIAFLTISCCVIAQTHSNPSTRKENYSQFTTPQLIDALAQLDAQSPGIDSAAIYESFIAYDRPGSFQMGVLGVAAPKVPVQMRELVRRGSLALPDLVKHIDDARPTKLKVGNIDSRGTKREVGVNLFMFTYFSDEYDPRLRTTSNSGGGAPRWSERDFKGSYTVKVGDVCFVLIGQIVNRKLFAVRYQPSAGLVVNSPIESPELAKNVKNDWSDADTESLRESLLADIQGANRPAWADQSEDEVETIYPALERLRFYFPQDYKSLKGGDLKERIAFESMRAKEDLNDVSWIRFASCRTTVHQKKHEGLWRETFVFEKDKPPTSR